MISFDIPGDPRGKGRPRFSTRGGAVRTFTDDKTAAYENLVTLEAQRVMAGRAPFQEPVDVEVTATLRIPASASKRRQAAMLLGSELPLKLPDLDNILKAVLDGCNQVVFADDKQVVGLTAHKRFGSTPGVFVKITPIAGA